MSQNDYLCTHLCILALRTLAQQGIPQSAVLRDTSIPKELFDEHDNVISYGQSLVLLENACRLSPSRELSFLMGSELTLSNCGMLGLGMMSSDTWGDALRLSGRYYRSLGMLLKGRAVIKGELVRIQALEEYPVGGLYSFLVEEQLSSNMTLYRLITGEEPELLEARFAFDPPAYCEIYQDVFGCECHFNCDTSELVYRRELLDTPALQPYPLAVKACCNYLDQHMPYQISQSESDKVRRILQQARGKFPEMREVASTLGTSVRSLRRQLVSQGTSFQEISKSVRQQQAQQYLRFTSLTLDEIAALLGFSEQSQFNRAFRRWTGDTPGAYRQKESG